MNTTIICKNCGEKIEITEALTHQIEGELAKKFSEKHAQELADAVKDAEKKALNKLEKDFALTLENATTEAQEEKKRNSVLLGELKQLSEDMRALRRKDEERDMEMKKKLALEEEAIRKQAGDMARQKSQEEIDQLQKQLNDTKKALADADYKLSQKSQQLQGEVLELNIERILHEAFPDDEILAVAKGKEGGDILQKVKGRSGRLAGIILWETKHAKWTPSWLPKLRENARQDSAGVAVLVSTNLPRDISDFQLIDGVIVCSDKHVIALATILRRSVLQIAVAKQTAQHKDENLELLYEYIQSESFRQRFEAFAEGIREMQEDLEYEKRAMERVWKKRDIQIKKSLIHASRMYGELQGVMGNALADIKTFSLPEPFTAEK